MEVKLVSSSALSSSSNATVDISEFLTMPTDVSCPPMMHTLQPLLSDNADDGGVTLDGILPTELETLQAADVPKTCDYDLLCSSTISAQSDLESGLLSAESDLANAVDVPMSILSSADLCLGLPSTASHYYIQSAGENSVTESSSPQLVTSLQQPAVVMSSQLPVVGNSPELVNNLLTSHLELSTVVPAAATVGNIQSSNVDFSVPPKKPLSPYMRFSKGIWQQVKSANPSMSVCEVGAIIGRMWREMCDSTKQHFNDDFALDKVRYDNEMQQYLLANGLQPSDVSKSKRKKPASETKEKSLAVSTAASAAPPLVTLTPEQMAEEMAKTILESAGIAAEPALLSGLAVDGSVGVDNLSGFTRVWSAAESNNTALGGADQTMADAGATESSQYCLPVASSQHAALYSISADNQLIANTDLASNQLLATGDDATSWLWQQYGADGQPILTDTQANDPNSALASATSLSEYVMAIDTMTPLEPGEVRTNLPVPTPEPAETASAYRWPSGNRDAAELALLRDALVTRGKEAARLTRELELAYKLIEHLQQQNVAYQQLEWSFQEQGVMDQSQPPGIENNIGLIVSDGIN